LINHSEVLAVASDLSLTHDIVEKDYVLGWLLAGIYAHEALASAWTFKGGTCLKKCYFETYRFSEDLDFTPSDQAHLDEGYLRSAFTAVSAWVYEESGLELPVDLMRFEIYRNPRGGLSCEGRIYYRGPLGRGGSPPRVRLDLTADEVLVLPPVERAVSHPYSDVPTDGIVARCYAYEEIFAEKIRALAERARPRDLYDVINLYRQRDFQPSARAVLDILAKKCAFKNMAVPTLTSLTGAAVELLADWQTMLGHQLPALPPFDNFWAALPEFFGWLESGAAPPALVTAPVGMEEEVVRPPVGFLRRQGVAGSSFLELVRFAGANRLCVDLDYGGSTRRIEPYSVRRTGAGNIVLYAVRVDSGESRSYRLDRMQGVRVTGEAFAPRYVVELSPMDLGIPPTKRGGGGPAWGSFPGGVRRGPRTFSRKGRPTYVIQCTVCGKKFERTKHGQQLRPHKTPQGWDCSGRTGFMAEVKY
jgi:predicted nucleotidyltransferase component of viral defense system